MAALLLQFKIEIDPGPAPIKNQIYTSTKYIGLLISEAWLVGKGGVGGGNGMEIEDRQRSIYVHRVFIKKRCFEAVQSESLVFLHTPTSSAYFHVTTEYVLYETINHLTQTAYGVLT